MQYLTKTQIENVLRVTFKHSYRDHLMALLAFMHGLRRGEVAGLTLEDVANNQIRARRLKGSLTTIHPLRKSDKILFNEQDALAVWLRNREAVAGNNALFPGLGGRGHIGLSTISVVLSQHMREAGIPVELAHPHALKHAICSQLARAGEKIEMIAQYVGHVDIKNTRRYLDISDDEASASAFKTLDSVGF